MLLRGRASGGFSPSAKRREGWRVGLTIPKCSLQSLLRWFNILRWGSLSRLPIRRKPIAMLRFEILLALLFVGTSALPAVEPPPIITDVEGQPLAANAERLAKALDFLGMPLPEATAKELATAIDAKDAKGVQKALDARVPSFH